MHHLLITSLCSAAICLAAVEPIHPTLPFDRSRMTVVDEVDLSLDDPGHRYVEVPKGAATTATILDRRCRILTGTKGGSGTYFAVRLGEGKGLQAGKAYVLELDYPEDAPRTVYVFNKGNDTRHGFHTGTTVGDSAKPPYITPNIESIDIPLAQAWRTWTQYFHLHDRTAEIKPDKDKPNPLAPSDGFWVIILHHGHENAPLSQGAAVATLRLYEAPPLDDIAATLTLPPKGLPQRHLFYREEMADGVFAGKDPDRRGVRDGLIWYEYHARLMRFLGMNTFSKDLLEFGHNQGWDSGKYGGNEWVYQSSTPDLWTRIVPMATSYGLNLLPMYEYCGSVGNNSYGKQRRARTLHQAKKGKEGADDYTHIWWSEKCNVDVTDSETVEDLRKILEITIADEAKRGTFIGAWLRPRSSAWPISFSDRCLKEFAKDSKRNVAVTRQQLIDDKSLYQAYWAWWYGRRKAFLNDVRDYLRSEACGIGSDAALLVTLDPAESGASAFPGGTVVTDDPARFAGTDLKTKLFSDVVAAKSQLTALTSLHSTWGGWEWQHAVPPYDPERYRDNPGVLQTWTFNRLYTVSDDSMEAFRTPDGLAMIRHYCLNEHALPIDGDKNPVGYFVMDVEYAGPHSMLAEARALANGDPRFIGYLAGNCFNRGFPQYARAFNQAFLALPAIPSTRVAQASTNPDVVVRSYDAGDKGHWFAVINTGLSDARDVTLTLPTTMALVDCLSGKPAAKTVSLYPGQVLAWRTR